MVCTLVDRFWREPEPTRHLYEAKIVCTTDLSTSRSRSWESSRVSSGLWLGEELTYSLTLQTEGYSFYSPESLGFPFSMNNPIDGGWPWDVSADWTCQHNLFLFFECRKV